MIVKSLLQTEGNIVLTEIFSQNIFTIVVLEEIQGMAERTKPERIKAIFKSRLPIQGEEHLHRKIVTRKRNAHRFCGRPKVTVYQGEITKILYGAKEISQVIRRLEPSIHTIRQ